MPRYLASVAHTDSRTTVTTFHFSAATDRDAVARMPEVESGSVIEIWLEKRLVAIIDEVTTSTANRDLECAARSMINSVR
jgi:hypothetical protein